MSLQKTCQQFSRYTHQDAELKLYAEAIVNSTTIQIVRNHLRACNYYALPTSVLTVSHDTTNTLCHQCVIALPSDHITDVVKISYQQIKANTSRHIRSLENVRMVFESTVDLTEKKMRSGATIFEPSSVQTEKGTTYFPQSTQSPLHFIIQTVAQWKAPTFEALEHKCSSPTVKNTFVVRVTCLAGKTTYTDAQLFNITQKLLKFLDYLIYS